MKWYVFSSTPEDAAESLTIHKTYGDAVFAAQCIHDTQNRPRRMTKGCYQLSGTDHSSYIATKWGMFRNGFVHGMALKFKVHFNRINMQRGNPNVWTVHNFRGCFQAERIIIEVPVETVFNAKGEQPRAYLTGRGCISICGNSIYIKKESL